MWLYHAIFCPRCGGRMEVRTDGTLYCPWCGFEAQMKVEVCQSVYESSTMWGE